LGQGRNDKKNKAEAGRDCVSTKLHFSLSRGDSGAEEGRAYPPERLGTNPSIASQFVIIGKVATPSCHGFVTSLQISRVWNCPIAPSPQGCNVATYSATKSKNFSDEEVGFSNVS
jgi:hypothetical protein